MGNNTSIGARPTRLGRRGTFMLALAATAVLLLLDVPEAWSEAAAAPSNSALDLIPLLPGFVAIARIPGVDRTATRIELGMGVEFGRRWGFSYGGEGAIQLLSPDPSRGRGYFSANGYYHLPQAGNLLPRLHGGIVTETHVAALLPGRPGHVLLPGFSYGIGVLKVVDRSIGGPLGIEFRGRTLRADGAWLRQWQLRMTIDLSEGFRE
jgi:hypothetical protein